MNTSFAPGRTLARFRLLRELGRGAQATVWLAHDPRLDREVAVKLLNADADESTRHEWLNEARSVSRLKHPNVVPVFEADEHGRQSYLVFEYVEGPTLQELRRKRPALPAREAVTLLMGVLDALAAAHDLDIVHRDLKPSNILLGGDGRPRVMDFGIAARVAQGDGRIVGTPGYMSPEAARGEAPMPSMDVFSAGVMLAEMLAGEPLMRESNPYRAVERVQQEDLILPATVKVDDLLRGIVQRALARQASERYDSARSFHASLAAWLTPEAQPAESDPNHATLEFLLRRMRRKTDFPALSASVVRIQRLAPSDSGSLASLSEEILKDVSLTNKLLRMVNTVQFTSVSGGGISTVSRAVALVGFAGIRNMALSVVLLEHMGDKGHAALLEEEFLRALMAGTLASDLTPNPRDGEDAFLAAMFHNLGRLLTEFYFPEEAQQVRERLAQGPATTAERDAAARQVLGLGYSELAAGVARSWSLPDTLQRALRPPKGALPTVAVDPRVDQGVERMRWLAQGANALTDAMLGADGEAQTAALSGVAAAYAPVLGLKAPDILASAQGARTRLSHLAQAMGLKVAADAPARRLLQAPVDPAAAMAATMVGAAAPASAAAAAMAAVPLVATPSALQARLKAGLDAVRLAVAQKSLRLNELLSLVLETMQQALESRCVVLCLREPRTGDLVGRVAVGAGSAEISAAIRIPIGSANDLFAVVCAKGADLLIADAKTMSSRLPAWYRQRVNAPTFLLLPMQLRGAPIGLIYADKTAAGSLVLTAQDLELLRALRDEAVASFGKGST